MEPAEQGLGGALRATTRCRGRVAGNEVATPMPWSAVVLVAGWLKRWGPCVFGFTRSMGGANKMGGGICEPHQVVTRRPIHDSAANPRPCKLRRGLGAKECHHGQRSVSGLLGLLGAVASTFCGPAGRGEAP
jgi:hypothetical protein